MDAWKRYEGLSLNHLHTIAFKDSFEKMCQSSQHILFLLFAKKTWYKINNSQ